MASKFQVGICFVCLVVAWVVSPLYALAAGTESFTVSSERNLIPVGSTVDVKVQAAGVQDLYGFEITVDLDPQYFELVSSRSLLNDSGVEAKVLSNRGFILASSRVGEEKSGVSGNTELASFTLKALRSGVSAIKLESVTYITSSYDTQSFSNVNQSITFHLNKSDAHSNSPGTIPNTPLNSGEAPAGSKPVPASATISVKPEEVETSNGEAKIRLNMDTLTQALSGTSGNDQGIRTVRIEVAPVEGAKAYSFEMPVQLLHSVSADRQYEIVTDVGKVVLPSNMLNNAGLSPEQNFTIRIAKHNLPNNADSSVQALVGERPVIDFTLTVSGKEVKFNNPKASVKVSVPYPLMPDDQDPEHIVVLYIDDMGNMKAVPIGRYVSKNSSVEFSTTHFSGYAVAYVDKKFVDTASFGWAEKAISVLGSKGIINGTTDSNFAPSESVTRADYLTLLVRTLGLTSSMDTNFSDVDPADYYFEAVGIAKSLGIVQGTGDNRFHPKERITREDMMVMTERALKLTTNLRLPDATPVGSEYSQEIASYARSSIDRLVQIGLIEGDNGLMKPQASATRAETAVLMYRIYQLL
ncbi:S-layer homology domain-containing protein [Paenibacillus rigui]|uniref:SLH domain-containing protein n=1 Tax=Paenibacillus rigui TaxID=554312 RepID=A0A229UU70_9BACL|nr:S-layer homology domain-containing protein [Paenibacillus rigui]OXM86924.1 hypothetical protein CF651_08755 [Paenibacillus rigui]